MTKSTVLRPLISQIRFQHSARRSQYLHCAKKAIVELYKLDIEDGAACAERVEYLLKEDWIHCPPDHYEVCPLQFLRIISDRSKTKSSYQYGQELSLSFLAHQILGL